MHPSKLAALIGAVLLVPFGTIGAMTATGTTPLSNQYSTQTTTANGRRDGDGIRELMGSDTHAN